MFLKTSTTIGNDISTKNEIIFSKDSVVLPCIDFHIIWNDPDLTDEQRENVWKYLHTLYILAFEHSKQQDFKTIIKELSFFIRKLMKSS